MSIEQKVEYQQTNPTAEVLATQETVKPASYDYMLATQTALHNKAKAAAISDFTVRLIKAENWVKTHEASTTPTTTSISFTLRPRRRRSS